MLAGCGPLGGAGGPGWDRLAGALKAVGELNGGRSDLRFLMMIREGNWFRFTASLTVNMEE